VLVVWQLIHEGEEETDPERIPNVEQNVLVFFRLKEGYLMDLEFPKRGIVEGMQ